MNKNILEIKDLFVEYRSSGQTVRAVNGVSFNITEGTSLGLVGETGAGKTTTALAITRLLPQRTGRVTAGRIEFQGENLLDIPEKAMRYTRGAQISMIFQDPMTSLNPIMSVGKQILESLEIHNVEHKTPAELDAKVDEILEMVGIPAGRKNEFPHQFSGGMKQRVVIAISLVCNPLLLIADEPTTALDVTIQAQVLNMMMDLKEHFGMSILLITHDIGVVAEICDYVAIMYAGEIVEQGTVQDIFEGEQHHPYTEGLFNSIPDLESKSKRLKPIEGLMPDPANLPEGCCFHPRCSRCTEICRTQKPPRTTIGTHEISCHLVRRLSDGHST